MTQKQLEALWRIGRGLSGAELHATHPTTRAALFRKGLVRKDWCHRHSMPVAGIEYLCLTDRGREIVSAEFGG